MNEEDPLKKWTDSLSATQIADISSLIQGALAISIANEEKTAIEFNRAYDHVTFNEHTGKKEVVGTIPRRIM